MVAQLDPNQNAGDFWTAMGIAPRPAFYLTVTVELATSASRSTGPLVTTRSTGLQSTRRARRPWIGIGGRVVDQAAARASPTRSSTSSTSTSAPDRGVEGRYSFPRVPPGAHTVRVVARGFQPKTQPLVVPGRPEDYVVELTPLP